MRAYVLPERLGGQATGFTATGSIVNPTFERDASRRISRRQRLYHIVVECGAWIPVLVILSLVGGVTGRILYEVYGAPGASRAAHDTLLQVLRAVGWPSNSWFLTLGANLTPLAYAFFPPDVAQRDRLMGKREENGARYPKSAEERAQMKSTPRVTLSIFVAFYFAYVFYNAASLYASRWI
ncbi:hypothetical protein B0T24DRAFT_70202 [Lasiosphaeria ovina]|uniref:Uncharacterized protein n=1 Tax=Lasiosphaeria ovina TaxID=92902 RepID=A0AAE0TY64_9PEZI|nr:hypothetical protein B0T24DRAFT_70202 [Lasiosphaeria ovina]